MSGKKKIAYPIELPFTIQEPILLNNAIDKYQLHKELIDQLLNALKGSFHVGYVRRQKKYIHGISANSLNEAIREKLKGIPGIEGETNVVFGTFLPPVKGKGEFDFSIYNKETKQILIDGLEVEKVNGKNYNNFPKASDNPICHVRPHARNAQDVDELPDGRMFPKQCFWLNKEYILSQLDENFLEE